MRIESFRIDFDEATNAHHALLVHCEDGGKVVSHCQLHELQSDHVSLCWVFVQPDSRRKGFGRTVVTEALRLAGGMGKKSVVLSVFKENAAAISLYESLGFRTHQDSPTHRYMVKFL